MRHQWGFNSLIGETDKKERTNHCHHAIDAVVIASTSRSLYQQAANQIKQNKLKIPEPYADIRTELEEKLKHVIVSHTPQRKLSGGLHEETGAGYVAKHGGLVYRKTLNPEFTLKNAMSIIDEQVKNIVLEHIENHKNSKEAFNEENLKTLKLGKNLIKRVRVLQKKIKTTKKQTAEDVLQQTKFGVKDKSGKIFKYMSYGNNHHVEIIQNIKTGKIRAEFVTMMEASSRVKGINIPKQPIVKTDYGDEWKFLMALHINDTVSIEKENGERFFYRVQKLGGGYDITLRLNIASTINDKDQCLPLMAKGVIESNLIVHKINAIGSLIDD
jgi:CRISPR-associated endonuclease Csn1